MTTTPKLIDCDVGLYPVEFNVIIAPEVVEEKTKSGLIMPDSVKDMNQNATTKGTLVAISPLAFSYADWPEGSRQPQVGDQVWFGKYAGTMIKGRDGQDLRLIKDRDVAVVIETAQ